MSDLKLKDLRYLVALADVQTPLGVEPDVDVETAPLELARARGEGPEREESLQQPEERLT